MTFKYLLLTTLMACMLTSCFAVPSLKDPFGAYEAKVTIAQYNRDARIAESENAAWAKVGSARAWSNTVPTVAFIIGLSVVIVVCVQWQGRITLERVKRGELPLFSDKQPMPTEEALKRLAARRNQQFKVVNGVALLIDKSTGEIVKQRAL